MAAEKRVNYVIPFTYIIVDIIFTMISFANAIQISYSCHQWLYRTTFKLWLTSAFAISPNFVARYVGACSSYVLYVFSRTMQLSWEPQLLGQINHC